MVTRHVKVIIVIFFFLVSYWQSPSVVWTEDYQVELMEENFKAFDQLRQLGYLVGEMIWNFADFATPQGRQLFGVQLEIIRTCC